MYKAYEYTPVYKLEDGKLDESVLYDLAAKKETKLQAAFLDSVNNVKERFTEEYIQSKYEAGQQYQLFNEMALAFDKASISYMLNDIDQGINEGGNIALWLIPTVAVLDVLFRFDPLSVLTLDFLRNYRTSLIQSLTFNSMQAVRQTAQKSSQLTLQQISKNIRATIGLDAKSEQALTNYRNMLTELDSGALRRELRDKRFDGTIRRAIADKEPLTQQQIDNMSKRYGEKLLKHRAEGIARTESLRSISMGQYAGLDQMVASNAINSSILRKFWQYTFDSRTRDVHRSVPSLNEGGVALNASFQTELGPMRFPRDPRGTTANVIRCRCLLVVRVVEDIEQ